MPRRWTQEELDAVRTQPLEPIARQLGYRQDPRDRARWKRSGSVLSINAPAFFDHQPGLRWRRCLRPRHAYPKMLLRRGRLHPRSHSPASRNHANNAGQPSANTSAMRAPSRPASSMHANAAESSTQTDAKTPSSSAPTLADKQPAPKSSAHTTQTGQNPFKAMARGSRKARGAFWIPASRPKTGYRLPRRKRPRRALRILPPGNPQRRNRLRLHRRRNQPQSQPGSKHGNQIGSSAHTTQTAPEIKTPRHSKNTIQGSNASDPKAQKTGTKSSSARLETNNLQQIHQTIRSILHPLP